MFSLSKKKVVVTGGGSGIGKAIAKLFARNGADVSILEMDIELAQTVAAEIRLAGLTAQAYACDISNYANVADVMQQIGNFHILINNAGIAHIGKADNTEEDDFRRLVNVNIMGVYHCLHAGIPQLKKSGGGVILNMASIAAWVGISERFAYSATKGAVIAMSLSVAKDYLKENIRCNTISPARVHTPFVDGFIGKNYPHNQKEIFQKLAESQPIGRMAKPEEVAALALYLCSDEASFITGCDYPIDGGFIKLNN